MLLITATVTSRTPLAPLPPSPTAHQVSVHGGPTVPANCAVDALGVGAMLGRDSDVRSVDPIRGEPVTASERGGQWTWRPAEAVVFFGSIRPGRRWRPGVTTGVLAAAPSTAAATGSALLAACGSCLGASSAVSVGAAGAAGGAAASGGMPLWQLVFAAAVFLVLAGLQLRRALTGASCRGGSGGRAGFVLRQLAPSVLMAAVAFAAVQFVVVPWLSAPPVPASPTLP